MLFVTSIKSHFFKNKTWQFWPKVDKWPKERTPISKSDPWDTPTKGLSRSPRSGSPGGPSLSEGTGYEVSKCSRAVHRWFSRLSHRKWLKPRPQSGLDWLMSARFARQRYAAPRCCVDRRVRYALNPGSWTLDPGPWTLDPGPRTLNSES